MKNIIATLALVTIANMAIAQAPNKFNYQGIARTASGTPVANQALGLRLTIHDASASGATLYQETQNVTTNAYGLYSTAIGSGTVVSGTIAGINWGMGDKYLQVEIDPAGGTSYTDAGTSQLLSVPYSLSTGKFSIPYFDSTTNTASLLKLQNNGDGAGVEGVNNATTANAIAIKGVINSTSPGGFSSAVRGINNGTGGLGIGVYGSQAGSGWGVYGTTPSGIGVYGNAGTSGIGLYGNSSTGTGLYAISNTGNAANIAISNTASSANALVVSTNGTGKAISATAASGNVIKATLGSSASSTVATAGSIYGESNAGIGVIGVSSSQNGMYGLSTVNSAAGVAAVSTASGGYGVWAVNTASGTAGYFQGNVNITGSISKSSGTFKIDDPIDPENKYLYHSFVESPDMMNVYNGNITTDASGNATVSLPAYFGALNKDFRYQLTVIGVFAQAIINREISNNQFSIKTDKPNVKVSWQVTGIRKDPYANAHRVVEEVEKEAPNKGKYLHPVEYGQPASKGIDYDKLLQLSSSSDKK
ncbi:MAG: hypothetical protein JST70_01735 [Bacteroidetes bacterium]|nr:hypothetical protein [Bacteroidota bacterium]